MSYFHFNDMKLRLYEYLGPEQQYSKDFFGFKEALSGLLNGKKYKDSKYFDFLDYYFYQDLNNLNSHDQILILYDKLNKLYFNICSYDLSYYELEILLFYLYELQEMILVVMEQVKYHKYLEYIYGPGSDSYYNPGSSDNYYNYNPGSSDHYYC